MPDANAACVASREGESQAVRGGARGAPTRAVAAGGPRPGGLSLVVRYRTEWEETGSSGANVGMTLGSASAMLIGQRAGLAGWCRCEAGPPLPEGWFPPQRMLAASSAAIAPCGDSSGSTTPPSANWLTSAMQASRKLRKPEGCRKRRAIVNHDSSGCEFRNAGRLSPRPAMESVEMLGPLWEFVENSYRIAMRSFSKLLGLAYEISASGSRQLGSE